MLKKRGRPSKASKAISQVEQDLMFYKGRSDYLERIIADTWWILTDIISHQLDPKYHLSSVSSRLADIAIDRLEKDNKDD